MGPESNVGLGGCWIIQNVFTITNTAWHFNIVAVPHKMARLERECQITEVLD